MLWGQSGLRDLTLVSLLPTQAAPGAQLWGSLWSGWGVHEGLHPTVRSDFCSCVLSAALESLSRGQCLPSFLPFWATPEALEDLENWLRAGAQFSAPSCRILAPPPPGIWCFLSRPRRPLRPWPFPAPSSPSVPLSPIPCGEGAPSSTSAPSGVLVLPARGPRLLSGTVKHVLWGSSGSEDWSSVSPEKPSPFLCV